MERLAIPWLLASDTPTTRYLALRHLRGLEEADHCLQTARAEVMVRGPVPAILAGQADGGHWRHERGYYTPKYTSTHWSMVLLTELHVDGADHRVQRGAESMLQRTDEELQGELDAGRWGLVCFWANLLRYALHAGFADDPRVERVVAYVAFNAGAPEWRCGHNGDLPCAWGAARALWGLGALPPTRRNDGVSAAIGSAVALLLDGGRLVGGDYPTSGRSHSLWGRLNAALFYQADVLFCLRALGEVGALAHPGCTGALDWLRGRADAAGRWRGVHPYARHTWPLFGNAEEVDRWVTVQSALVLRRAAEQRGVAA